MNLLAKSAALGAVALFCAASAQAATVVAGEEYYESNALTFIAPDDEFSEVYELSGLTSFDLVFSGTGLEEDLDKVSYVVTESDGDILASGVLTGSSISSGLAAIDTTAITFWTDEDFTIALSAAGLSDDFSFTYSLIAPSASVPLPAGIFLLGGLWAPYASCAARPPDTKPSPCAIPNPPSPGGSSSGAFFAHRTCHSAVSARDRRVTEACPWLQPPCDKGRGTASDPSAADIPAPPARSVRPFERNRNRQRRPRP